MNAFFLSDVPDPTDFPDDSISPGLRTMDSSLRCSICGELYDAPVTLPCGHCFCSCCVRTAISNKQECPSCRKAANEGHIRPNPVMEEVVLAWQRSRPYMLDLSKADERRKRRPHSEESDRQNSTPFPRKRKRGPESSSAASSRYTTPPGSPTKRPTSTRKAAASSDDVFDLATVPTSDVDEDQARALDPGPDAVVNCPLCAKRVKYKNINAHIDRGCKTLTLESETSDKVEWRKILDAGNKGKQKLTNDDIDDFPLPKASYDTLKDKRIKEMLLEHNLPTTGDRSNWIQRHQRWVTIHNANLDRSLPHRKTKADLRKELKQWEEEKAKKKRITVDDPLAHVKRHKSEFAQLIEVAKPKRLPSQPPSHISAAASTASVVRRSQFFSKGRDPTDEAIVLDSEEGILDNNLLYELLDFPRARNDTEPQSKIGKAEQW